MNRNAEILETRLRVQEDRLADLETQLSESRAERKVAQRDANALRAQLAGRGKPTLLPEQARSLYSVSGIQLSKLLTGSLDSDGKPGAEMLSAVIVPHDEQGSLVKVPGQIELELLDLSKSGDEKIIGRWEFDRSESRQHWHRGWISSGYWFKLPWQQSPTSRELVLHARLTTIDGRRFDTSLKIVIDEETLIAASEQSAPPEKTSQAEVNSASPDEGPGFSIRESRRRIASSPGVEIGRRSAPRKIPTEKDNTEPNDDGDNETGSETGPQVSPPTETGAPSFPE